MRWLLWLVWLALYLRGKRLCRKRGIDFDEAYCLPGEAVLEQPALSPCYEMTASIMRPADALAECGRAEARLRRNALLIFAFVPALWALSPVFGGLLAALPVFLWLNELRSRRLRVREIGQEILEELPAVLTSLLLSLRAGALLDEAWEEAAAASDGILSKEMRRISGLRNEGVGIVASYRRFGESLPIPLLRDIAGSVSGSRERGGLELIDDLERKRQRLFEQKRAAYRKEAQRASQLLIFPGLLVFFAILVLVMVPLLIGAL